MDEAGVDLASAASLFGVSEQTIYNWRSTRGVADSKAEWVESRMRDYIGSQQITNLPERITLEITPEQFDDWSQAALSEGKILRQWAIDSLDAAAEEASSTGYASIPNPLHSLPIVADEGKAYGPGSGSDDVISAPLGDIFQSGSDTGVA